MKNKTTNFLRLILIKCFVSFIFLLTLSNVVNAECNDPAACNYTPPTVAITFINCDYGDENCPEPCNVFYGCTNPAGCNYNPVANCDDGSCEFETCLGSIGDFVWLDENADGVQDPGETGIVDVTVILTSPDGTTDTTNTDADGLYIFEGLEAGDYVVTVGDGPDNMGLTTTGVDDVALGPGKDYFDADFGFDYASIGGYVWSDENADCIQDPNEAGISGVEVILIYSENAMDTTFTDDTGSYIFGNLESGIYTVTIGQGPDSMGLINSGTDTVELSSGEDYGDAYFCFEELELDYIEGITFNDANNNGIQDSNEAGIPGVIVTITYPDGNTETTTTDDDGVYSFDELPEGTYTVTVNDGLIITNPSTGCGGDFSSGTVVSINVWDEYRGGCKDPLACNFSLLANCDNGSCEYDDTGCTDPVACNFDPSATCDNGFFCDYGEINCPEPCNVIFGCIDATACNFDPLANCDDGSCEFDSCKGSIRGTVFRDENCNGIQDIGEEGIPNISINSNDADGNVLVTETDSNGNYNFDNLQASEYILTVSLYHDGSILTTPDNQGVNLSAGEDYVGTGFGYSNDSPIFNVLAAKPDLCLGESTEIEVFPLIGADSFDYKWSTGDTTKSIIVTPTRTQEYKVTVTNKNGCPIVPEIDPSSSASIKIYVSPFGFTSEVTNELIIKCPSNKPVADLAEETGGVLVKDCDCSGFALIKYPEIIEGRPRTCLDIEERCRNLTEAPEPETVGINYRFDYCETSTECDKCSLVNGETAISNNIVVGVMDTGIDSDYENQFTFPTSDIDCEIGYIIEDTLVIGIDKVCNSSLQDQIGHGTHVSNIITNDEADRTKVFIVQAFEKNCENSDLFSMIRSLNQITKYNKNVDDISKKIRILNLSMGYYGNHNALFKEAIDSLGKSGTIVVCSAGNSSSNLDDDGGLILDTLKTENGKIIVDTILIRDHYPSEFTSENLICVAAWDYLGDSLAGFSNYGVESVDIVAPGYKIKSKIPFDLDKTDTMQDGLGVKSGTSMATPIITRWIANLISQNPTLEIAEVKETLRNQVESINGLNTMTSINGLLPFKVEEQSCARDIIEGYVWIDKNNNGFFDRPSEMGSADVKIILQSTLNDEILISKKTNDRGKYSFGNLMDGDYVVSFGESEEIKLSSKSSSFTINIPETNLECYNFGISTSGCVDSTACNYNSNATTDDGSCFYKNINCSDPCDPLCEGCGVFLTSIEACECGGLITVNVLEELINETNHWYFELFDGSGELLKQNASKFPPVVFEELCAGNYSIKVSGMAGDVMDCLQEFEVSLNCESSGCTDPLACNYNAEATTDDSTCNFGDSNCLDPCNCCETPALFVKYPFLNDLLDPCNCYDQSVKEYDLGLYAFVSVIVDTKLRLFFEDGTPYCNGSATFDCISLYDLNDKVTDSWNCPNIEKPVCNPYDDYPWLSDLMPEDECFEDTEINVYNLGEYSFVEIIQGEIEKLYLGDGTYYCTNEFGISCKSYYGLLPECIFCNYKCLNDGSNSERLMAENKDNLDFKIFPNPSNGEFRLLMPYFGESSTFIKIYNTKGQIKREINNAEELFTGTGSVNLQDFANGIYFIEISNGYNSQVKRLVIQR